MTPESPLGDGSLAVYTKEMRAVGGGGGGGPREGNIICLSPNLNKNISRVEGRLDVRKRL